MASCSRSNNVNGSLLFRTETPHFFKIVQQNLAIPRKFVRTYGDDLSTPVILKAPSGKKWKVEIAKSGGDIWLQNGWQEFAEYYSVVDGSFLVFEFVKTNSEFNVFIFDMSATEIDYPFTYEDEEQVPEEPNVVVDIAKSDVSVEISPSTSLIRNAQAQAQAQAQEPEKQRANTRMKALTEAEKAKAVEIAMSNFHSENPSFQIVMQPSYVYKSNAVQIPSSFARKFLNKNGDAILNIIDGRSWPIKFYYSTGSGRTMTRINNSGWQKFVKDNDLQFGDVCIFELLECVDKIIFRVTIFKYSKTSPGNSKQLKEKESCSKQPKLSSDYPKRQRVERTCNIVNENDKRKKIKLQSSEKTSNRDCSKGQVEGRKNTKEISSFSFGNHTFQIVMQPSNFVDTQKYHLRLPSKFVKNMEQGSHKVRLQVDNKLWSVKLSNYPYAGVFNEGWIEFARQNSLKVGDKCTFELIDSEILLIGVSISRD